MEISELINELIEWIKNHSVSVANVNIVSSDDLLRILKGKSK